MLEITRTEQNKTKKIEFIYYLSWHKLWKNKSSLAIWNRQFQGHC